MTWTTQDVVQKTSPANQHEMETSPEITSLLKKIVSIYVGMKNVEKTGYNDFKQYAYFKEEDLMNALKPLLIENKVVIIPNVLMRSKIGDLSIIKQQYMIVDAESGQWIKVYNYGEGQDNQDKGIYKAYTGALKYFIMKTFFLGESGDDPEFDGKGNGRSAIKEYSSEQLNPSEILIGFLQKNPEKTKKFLSAKGIKSTAAFEELPSQDQAALISLLENEISS